MTRGEFRLISGQGASPSVEDITKRPATRRHFKTLQVGSGEPEPLITIVTIKGIDKATGETVWQYGPGSMWRHHYGADEISGIVPDTGATLDKYVIAASDGAVYVNAGNRSAATLTANAAECLTITKLDSLDGSVVESAALTGLFCQVVGDGFYQLSSGYSITETCALSGGDYVIVGQRVPAIEFVDFTSNTVNKSYILHAHNQQGGNVYVKTRTSSEVITIPYNSTASAVEALFEATSDCVAATVTGGPWPHSPIEIDVEWSVAGGDIAAIKTEATYSASLPGTGTSAWDWTGTSWTLLNDSCITGVPDEPDYSGTTIGETATMGCVIGSPYTSNVAGVATTYDTGTGRILNSVGRIFGRRGGETLSHLIASSETIPTITGGPQLGIYQIVAGPSNSVLITPSVNTNGNGACVEAHTVGGTWPEIWKWFFSGALYGIHIEDGSFCASFAGRTFTAGFYATAIIDATAGTVTAYNPPWGSTAATFQQNQSLTLLLMDDITTKCGSDYELTVTDADYPNLRYRNNFEGSEVWHDGTEMLLGVTPVFGADATAVYGLYRQPTQTVNANPPARTPATGSIYTIYEWTFQTALYSRFGSATQFRFRFGTSFTSWLNWNATEAEIQTAILTVFPENTSGVISNVVVNPFGSPSAIVNTDASWLEQGLTIHFNAAKGTSGTVYGFPSGARFVNGQVSVQLQSVANYNTPGIAAWDATDASVIWSRAWGTSGATTITHPERAWLRGDFVYAYGSVVDAE